MTPSVLLSPVGLEYENAQRFSVPPRLGLYNITAAGASGGRGVCNAERGYGIARTVQVELYINLELLILVGQQGSSFCDAEPNSLPCQYEYSSLACNDMWSGYVGDTFGNESMLNVLGGSGGGGASMVRAYSKRSVDPDPIVIGAGGGGASASLQYDIVNELGINVMELPSNLSYQYYINADCGVACNSQYYFELSNLTIYRAGIGGGYDITDMVNLQDMDGGYLSSRNDFAVGGLHCVPMNGSIGGFGGGGGGCAGGGGGGGYVGGNVLSEGRFVPGGGGISYTGNPFKTSFKRIHYIGDTLNRQLDGYVDIVHADCECIFKCEVYEENDAFECTCPRNSLLAPDSNDCYYGNLFGFIIAIIIIHFIEVDMLISEGPIQMLPPDENGVVFNYQQFMFDVQLFLYSVDFQVIVEHAGMNEGIFQTCIVGFLSEDNVLVAHTDVHWYEYVL